MENRVCANYKIINSLRISDRIEIVIGKNPKAPLPYVCWKCVDSSSYEDGDYCTTYRGAMMCIIKKLNLNEYYIPFDIPDAEEPVENEGDGELFDVSIDAEATWTYRIRAKSQDEAYEKAGQMISEDPDFYDKYREDCELMDARVYYNN